MSTDEVISTKKELYVYKKDGKKFTIWEDGALSNLF